jgi:predicted PurR-regulated permease PerM
MDPHNLNESVAGKMIVATIVLAGLYIGRDLLVPIALAIFLSFVLHLWCAPFSVGAFLKG